MTLKEEFEKEKAKKFDGLEFLFETGNQQYIEWLEDKIFGTKEKVDNTIQNTDNDEQDVHVICWNHTEYDRKASRKEISEHIKNGYAKLDPSTGITFDFTMKNRNYEIKNWRQY